MQIFNPLHDDSMRAIAGNLLAETVTRVASLGMHLQFTEAAVTHLCSSGFDVATGARKLRRSITALVEDKLSDFVLIHGSVEGKRVLVDSRGGEMAVLELADGVEPLVAGQGELLHFPVDEEVTLPPCVEHVSADA
jgi:ATP-dependent Clp protease ATP-binding subunit ClpA